MEERVHRPAPTINAVHIAAHVFTNGVWRTPAGDNRCALGRGGVRPADEKREGDGATPAGVWPLRRVLYREDRLTRPKTHLPLRAIGEMDGWCDDPDDPAYNRPVRLPYSGRHEVLRRDDNVYDVIVVLGHNDDPPEPHLGSAIFLHVARDGYEPTEGCIAVAREDLLGWLETVRRGAAVAVSLDSARSVGRESGSPVLAKADETRME